MMPGTLSDAGPELERLKNEVAKLWPDRYDLQRESVVKWVPVVKGNALHASRFLAHDIIVEGERLCSIASDLKTDA